MRHAFVRLALAVGVLSAASAMAGTVVVTPTNLGNWAPYSTNSSGIINTGTNTADFVVGPGSPPLGAGSAHFEVPTGNGTGSAQLRFTVPTTGILLSSITELKYSTFVPTAADFNGQQVPWLTLWVATDGTNYDDRLRFEPTYSPAQGPITTGTWQQWDGLTGKWYDDNSTLGSGPSVASAVSWSDLITALGPTATLINDPTQGIGGLRIASGFSSAGDHYNTNVDEFILGTTALGTTTYDFEKTSAAPVPLPAAAGVGFSMLGGFGGLAALRKRFRGKSRIA